MAPSTSPASTLCTSTVGVGVATGGAGVLVGRGVAASVETRGAVGDGTGSVGGGSPVGATLGIAATTTGDLEEAAASWVVTALAAYCTRTNTRSASSATSMAAQTTIFRGHFRS